MAFYPKGKCPNCKPGWGVIMHDGTMNSFRWVCSSCHHVWKTKYYETTIKKDK